MGDKLDAEDVGAEAESEVEDDDERVGCQRLGGGYRDCPGGQQNDERTGGAAAGAGPLGACFVADGALPRVLG